MEVPFSSFIAQRLAELSADLHGEADGHKFAPLGDHLLQKGKLLLKSKGQKDAYQVGGSVFSYAVLSINV